MGSRCWHEFIRTPIQAPILEFEAVLYNGILNLGRNPNVNVPLLELEGIKTADRQMYDDDVDEIVKEYVAKLGWNFEELMKPQLES
jgi:hypothetical protein